MAPITHYGLCLLATASVAVASLRNGHRDLHQHRKLHGTGSYGRSNSTGILGATGTGVKAASNITATSTRTETRTNTITQTVLAASGDLAVVAAAATSCGSIVYVTVTANVTVTATADAQVTTSSVASIAETTSSVASSTNTTSSAETLTSYPARVQAYHVHHSKSSDSTTEAAVSATTAVSSVASTTEVATTSTSVVAETTAVALPATTSSSVATTASTTTVAVLSAYTTAVSTSTSSSASASASSTGGTIRTKRGCLYNDAGVCTTLGEETVSWATNWASSAAGGAGNCVFVPQLWGEKTASTWAADAVAALAAGAPALLGMNEPDWVGQAQMTPAAGAVLWEQVSVYKGKATLVSPSVTSNQANGVYTGLQWLQEFATAGASWDATGVHFYSDCTTQTAAAALTYLQGTVSAAATMFGKPVWLTEFGCLDGATTDQMAAFFNVAIPYLESESSVAQYAAYKADFFVTNGALNTAGTAYVTPASS